MSERRKPHNGRDLSGHFRVKQVDAEDLAADPDGVRFMGDDVKLGGAVADTGPLAGQRGVRIDELVTQDREKGKRRPKGK